jgi:GT2 family glycosyltransferase
MSGVSVCVPVLKRYDLLRDMLESLRASTVQPERVLIIDNGRDLKRVTKAIQAAPVEVLVEMPYEPMGLAESWNWFIEQTSDARLITNDDITFAPNSLEAFLNTEGDLIEHVGINMCSCFLLRDSCVAKVGVFDETISPGYAYFEDCDYAERIALVGAVRMAIDCGVKHVGSATPSMYSPSEHAEHNRKFLIAQENFITKWGRMPGGLQATLGHPIEMVRQR